MGKTKVAVIGSGNIGTDLLIKLQRSESQAVIAMVGIEEASDGLARARKLGVVTSGRGVNGLIELDEFDDIVVIFDASSARAHVENALALAPHGKQLIDLTPAALGPFVVPVVNLDEVLWETNVNLISCGGQATIPIVAAISDVTPVLYAEIVASIASRSAGPGTRANVDEFTETTARGLEIVGRAAIGKAIIVLNPAEPPRLMRDTVQCLVDEDADRNAIEQSVETIVTAVQRYVPGYRLKQRVQFERFSSNEPLDAPSIGFKGGGQKVTVFIEVEGAGHYLPTYAGNLDIMTSAAVATAERLVELREEEIT